MMIFIGGDDEDRSIGGPPHLSFASSRKGSGAHEGASDRRSGRASAFNGSMSRLSLGQQSLSEGKTAANGKGVGGGSSGEKGEDGWINVPWKKAGTSAATTPDGSNITVNGDGRRKESNKMDTFFRDRRMSGKQERGSEHPPSWPSSTSPRQKQSGSSFIRL